MRKFDYEKTAQHIIDDQIIRLLTQIYELKGMHNYILKYSDMDFTNMKRISRINSLIGAHKIEKIEIPLKNIEYMLDSNRRADNDNAHIQFQGYHEALDYVYNDNTVGLNVDLILEMLKKTNEHNEIGVDEYRRGERGDIVKIFKDAYFTRFEYQSAYGANVSTYIENAISAFKHSVTIKRTDPLIATTILISDYLAIKPFYSHNKKVCWLLFSYLLKFCGFNIAQYVSLEKIIAENEETFYKVWEHTMLNWNEGKNDYKEMTIFLLSVVLQAYKTFSDYIKLYNSDMSKPERIEYILKDRGYETTKRELIELCPDISDTTIEITLGDLLRVGKIEKIGGGRYTSYLYKYHC